MNSNHDAALITLAVENTVYRADLSTRLDRFGDFPVIFK